MIALTTFFTCIPGINPENRYARFFCFVDDELPQFVESPLSKSFLLRSIDRYLKALEIFQPNSSICARGNRNDLFGNDVIGVFLESCFVSGKFLQVALGRLASFRLKGLFDLVHFYSDSITPFAGKKIPIGRGGDVFNTKIDTKNAPRFNQFRFVNVTHTGEIKLTPDQQEVRFSLAKREELPLILAHDKGDFKTPLCCADRDNVVLFGKSQNVVIVRVCRIFSEYPLRFFVQLIRIGHLCNAAYYHVRDNAKLVFSIAIGKFLKVILPQDPGIPTNFRQIVTGCIGSLKCFSEDAMLWCIRKKLYVHHDLHNSKYRHYIFVCQRLKEEWLEEQERYYENFIS